MAKKFVETIEVDGQLVPVNVFSEWRKNARVSIGKKGINLRLPHFSATTQKNKYLNWCREWVEAQLRVDPKIKARIFRKKYRNGDILTVGTRTYQLDIQFEARKTHTAKINGGFIFLKMNQDDELIHMEKSMRHLLSRVIAQDFQAEIERRVDQINDRHFQQDIKSIRIKYNESNWGSCSAKGNVNLSSRLLFAPSKVIDYVIIHELAHLIELNHSKRFWDIVKKAMPDYKESEQWLKDFGHLCNF